jgi:hypothetical protein
MSRSGLPDVLRTRSARLAGALAWLLAGLGLLLLLERFSEPVLVLMDGDAGAGARIGLQLAAALPEVCYLLGLWWVRRALVEFARGAFHTPMIALALRRVGTVLTAGAAFKVFILPSLERLLGDPPGYLVAYDIDSLVLCGLGLALAMLAHVLERAAAVQAELDEIF